VTLRNIVVGVAGLCLVAVAGYRLAGAAETRPPGAIVATPDD
jgi:hypothetical protein